MRSFALVCLASDQCRNIKPDKAKNSEAANPGVVKISENWCNKLIHNLLLLSEIYASN